MPDIPLNMKIDFQDAMIRLVNPKTGEDVLEETLDKTSFSQARPSFFSGEDEQQKGKKGPTMVLIVDLHWFTTANDLISEAREAGVTVEYADIVFAEHKVNGKTKGSVTITCRSHEMAERLVSWFSQHLFQGKKMHASFFDPDAVPYVPRVPPPSPQQGRPLIGTQALLAHGPTNAHGGINFNRVRPTYRTNHQTLGIGRPTSAPPRAPYMKARRDFATAQTDFQPGQFADPFSTEGLRPNGWTSLRLAS
ncbi:hypothetical protein BCR39DRAFT_239363 [Naematelia encephala]|uniref:RRM domain-containing protein n=1 Tax=Naematelia encephala TaxID=71784 RepID=A0A1Y2AXK6_9TREE|nr:hypothetical protein BCR39DRAFT_239363 [Naematelia encephala]